MLHVTYASGKSNRYKAYTASRDAQSGIVHAEDEVTSTVLGPLDFLAPAAVHTFWKTVFSIAGFDDLLPSDPPARSSVIFWDARAAQKGGLRIEPDGRVDLFWDGKQQPRQQTLLIEVKWRAPLSGDDQLHRQWCDYLTDDERLHTYHVFIGIETTAGLAAKHSVRGDVWQGRLILLSWLQIRAAFSRLSVCNNELGRWARLANHFLEKVGIQQFLGFTNFQNARYAIKPFSAPVFWNGFSPWAWVSQIELTPAPAECRIFWFN